uniref:hypothetical protein n=1 Tax=Streptomyces sp. AC1-42T TaxID=2218665 RepID=UPI001F5438A3|nr:hypothetical protein [Streptomyces sp. AC1-42T]
MYAGMAGGCGGSAEGAPAGGGGPAGCGGAVGAAGRSRPHFIQKRASSGAWVPQKGQYDDMRAPQRYGDERGR